VNDRNRRVGIREISVWLTKKKPGVDSTDEGGSISILKGTIQCDQR